MITHTRSPTFALLLAVLLPFVTGCAPVYVPNTVHAPQLDEQGDVQLGGYFGSSGVDVQAAAAVSDHVGVMADFSAANQEEQQGSEGAPADNFHRHQFGEVGLGYFGDVGSRADVGVYGGFGIGQAEATDNYEFVSADVVKASGNYNRWFVQPSMHLSAGPVRFLSAVRFARVHFGEFETNRRTYSANESELFLEPALGLSLGTSTVRFDTQFGISRPLAGAEEVAFDYEPSWLSFGVQVNLN